MSIVKVGAKVRLLPTSQFWGQSEGRVGTVIAVETSSWCVVRWDNTLSEFGYRYANVPDDKIDIELVKPIKITQKRKETPCQNTE